MKPKRGLARLGIDSRRPKSKGQALVEFALVLPVFVLILVAIFDLGQGVYAYNTVANAARVGARIAAVNQIPVSPDCHEDRPVESVSDPHWSIQTCAAQYAFSLGISPATVTVSYSTPPGTSLVCTDPAHLMVGCIANVTVEYTYTPMTPLIGNIMGPIHIRSTSHQPIERVFP